LTLALLAKKFTPPKTARIVCVPGLNEFKARVATPKPSGATVPSVVAVVRSSKVTVPVGVTMLGETGATVAVNVTNCPKLEGFGSKPELQCLPEDKVLTVSLLVSPAEHHHNPSGSVGPRAKGLIVILATRLRGSVPSVVWVVGLQSHKPVECRCRRRSPEGQLSNTEFGTDRRWWARRIPG
jgi:hypothetical protein